LGSKETVTLKWDATGLYRDWTHWQVVSTLMGNEIQVVFKRAIDVDWYS